MGGEYIEKEAEMNMLSTGQNRSVKKRIHVQGYSRITGCVPRLGEGTNHSAQIQKLGHDSALLPHVCGYVFPFCSERPEGLLRERVMSYSPHLYFG